MTLARPLASNARSASLCGGMLRRRNMDTAESSAEVGGWPRPSFRWQRWQERALNSGPRPSAEVVDDGDVTQRRRNRPLPILKSSSRLKLMLAELRSEEHTSELQSLMRISYAVLCLKKKINDSKL